MIQRSLPLLILVVSLSVLISTTSAQSPTTGPYAQVAMFGRGAVRSVAWSPDGQVIAVGSTVGIWLYSSTLEPAGLLAGHTRAAYALDFSPEGTRLASASHDRTVRLWDIVTRTELAMLEGHTDLVVTGDLLRATQGRAVASPTVATNPAGTRRAEIDAGGIVRLTDNHTGVVLAELPGRANAVSWSADGRLAVALRNGTIAIWMEP